MLLLLLYDHVVLAGHPLFIKSICCRVLPQTATCRCTATTSCCCSCCGARSARVSGYRYLNRKNRLFGLHFAFFFALLRICFLLQFLSGYEPKSRFWKISATKNCRS